MLRSKPQPIRNKLGLIDRTQVCLVEKRLELSDTELTAIVSRIGNSLSAISNEAAMQKANSLQQPSRLPSAAVITSVTGGETTEAEAAAVAPISW
ncbi:hypothetical protein AB7M74_008731 [Bradyrhizobium japonicum]